MQSREKNQMCLQAARQDAIQEGEDLHFELLQSEKKLIMCVLEVLKLLDHSFVKISL